MEREMISRFGLTSIALWAGAIAAPASAAIFTTYQDPAGDREFKYFAPGPEDLMGQVSIDAEIDFQIDLTEEGLGVLSFPGATISKSAQVSDVTELVAGTLFTAEVFNATFEIRDSEGALILAGSYGMNAEKPFGGDLMVLTESGTLNTNSTDVGGSLTYSVGDEITDALASAGLTIGGAVDGVWTITAITAVAIEENGFFGDFEANSAFTGTIGVIPIPAPAAGLLVGLMGGLSALRRHRA
jgi:hypothetical protein